MCPQDAPVDSQWCRWDAILPDLAYFYTSWYGSMPEAKWPKSGAIWPTISGSRILSVKNSGKKLAACCQPWMECQQ